MSAEEISIPTMFSACGGETATAVRKHGRDFYLLKVVNWEFNAEKIPNWIFSFSFLSTFGDLVSTF